MGAGTTRRETRYGCFLPDLTGLARAPSAQLPRRIWRRAARFDARIRRRRPRPAAPPPRARRRGRHRSAVAAASMIAGDQDRRAGPAAGDRRGRCRSRRRRAGLVADPPARRAGRRGGGRGRWSRAPSSRAAVARDSASSGVAEQQGAHAGRPSPPGWSCRADRRRRFELSAGSIRSSRVTHRRSARDEGGETRRARRSGASSRLAAVLSLTSMIAAQSRSIVSRPARQMPPRSRGELSSRSARVKGSSWSSAQPPRLDLGEHRGGERQLEGRAHRETAVGVVARCCGPRRCRARRRRAGRRAAARSARNRRNRVPRRRCDRRASAGAARRRADRSRGDQLRLQRGAVSDAGRQPQ